jgi:hypothetical protein
MIRLAEEIRARGGAPLDPQDYKAEYTTADGCHRGAPRGAGPGGVGARGAAGGGVDRDSGGLRARGTAIYIASGTDEHYVLEEARLLGLDAYAPAASTARRPTTGRSPRRW